MSYRFSAREEAKIDMVLVQNHLRIFLKGHQFAVICQHTGPLEDIAPTVYEDFVLRRGPD